MPDACLSRIENGSQPLGTYRDSLLLKPGDVQTQRKAVHVRLERLGELRGHDEGRVGVIALSHVKQPRKI